MVNRFHFSVPTALCCAVLVMSTLGRAGAQDSEGRWPAKTTGPYYHGSENELRARKLMRGVANIALSVAEIPNQAIMEAHRTSWITGAVVGAVKGTYKGAKRIVVGLWEVATFYAPMNNYYQPYIEPEVVMMEHLH